METRRLWAAETWIVFTLYSIFIYLFSIEVASEDGEPILNKLFKIKKYITLQASPEEILAVFEKFEENPKSYSFRTHKGVTPVEGKLSEAGSVFETQEKFLLFPIKLRFKTVAVKNTGFYFKLIKPLGNLGIKGKFYTKRVDEEETRLYLGVYSKKEGVWEHFLLSIIFITPIRTLIGRQLGRELRFIKKQLASL